MVTSRIMIVCGCGPIRRQDFCLLPYRERRDFLFIWRIAIFTEDTLDQGSEGHKMNRITLPFERL